MRLRLLSAIKATDAGEACVCDLTPLVGLAQPTVSHHLKVLVEAGLLEREKRGTWAWFRIVPPASTTSQPSSADRPPDSVISLSRHAVKPAPGRV